MGKERIDDSFAMSKPVELGFRMPAEWEPHAATWLTWPRPDGISFPGRYDVVPPVYANLIRHLIATEEVHLNVWDEDAEQAARAALAKHGGPADAVQYHRFPSYEPWCRDHGPIFLVRDVMGKHERAIVDWKYNAWGGKYPPYELDDAIPAHIARFRELPRYEPGMVLEGGAIEVNGTGSLITTESCLLNNNRNPGMSQMEVERKLKDYLGVTHILWLNGGMVGDDTDGHIDQMTRFVSATTVVTVVEEDPEDVNYQVLNDNLRRLRSFRDQNGKLLRIVKLPTPGFVEHQGQRLPASYANFYIANGIVLLPTFRHPNDLEAVSSLQMAFPRHRVVGIDSSDIIWGLGSFHCLTQQEPL